MSKIRFWEDDVNSQSAGRLIFLVGSIWNMTMTTFLLIKGQDPLAVLGFFSGVGGVFGGMKLFQNSQENADKKVNTSPNNSTDSPGTV